MATNQKFPFGIEWVREKICAKCGVEAEIENYHLDNENIVVGYCSSIDRIRIEWKNHDQKLPKCVVLKVPSADKLKTQIKEMPTSEEMKIQFESDMDRFMPQVHRNECELYSLFAQNSPVPIPMIYESLLLTPEQQGVILMQDLSSHGVTIRPPMSLEQLYALVDALAGLHAFSLRDPQTWREKKFEFMDKAMLRTWPETVESVVKQAQELKPEYFEGALEKISWCFDVDLFYDGSLFGHLAKSFPEVLVHGDLLGNVLFDKIQTSRLVSVIDWQCCHGGNIMEDLARCLLTGLEAQTRRENTQKVLSYYYEKLVEYLGRKPFEFEVVTQSFELVLPYTMVFHLIALALDITTKKVTDEGLFRTKCAIEDVAQIRNLF